MNSTNKWSYSMKINSIEIIPVEGLPIFQKGDDISKILLEKFIEQKTPLAKGDLLVISHSIISVIEGCVYHESEVTPSEKAKKIASRGDISDIKTEVALQEAVEVIRDEPVLVTRTRQGIITDYSGVDESNAPIGFLIALPRNPDKSALEIHEKISESLEFKVPVIITDTQGRPWRRGAVNLAIGLAGFSPFTINEEAIDIHGKPLRSSLVCIADEIAASSELLMGQANEKIPVVIVRGLHLPSKAGTAKEINREDSENLFQ